MRTSVDRWRPRLLTSAASAALSLALVLKAHSADAQANDLALNRLTYFDSTPSAMNPSWSYNGGCGTMSAGYARCFADNQLFANLANELGGALAPGLLAPAASIGYNRVYIAYENSIVGIDGAGAHWQRGTEGSTLQVMGDGTGRVRTRVPNVLFVSRLHMRHGLPLGFELGVQGSYLHDSSMVAMGLDIKWSLFEGFRHGVGYLPDFAVRGSVNTLVGNTQMYLTVVSVDAMLSKAFTITSSFTVTPYLGGQALMVLGDSTVIDGTPTRSSYQECSRRHTEFVRDPMTNQVTGSNLVCDAGTGTPAGAENDSVNDLVFNPVRILRWRGMGGLRAKYGIVTFTAEFAMDLAAGSWLNAASNYATSGRPVNAMSNERGPITLSEFRQYSISLGAGVTF